MTAQRASDRDSVISPARRLAGYALVATAASSWGLWPLVLHRAEVYGRVPPTLQSALVMAIMTAVTLPLAFRDSRARQASAPRSAPRPWGAMAALGVSDALNLLLFFGAYRATSVAVAVLTHYLAPILVALLAPLVLREREGVRTRLAVAIAFTGLVLLLEPWRATLRASDLLGAALGAGSAAFYATNVLVQKRFAGAFTPSELMGYHGVLSTLILACAVPAPAWSALDPRAAAVLAVGAIGPGALAGLAFVGGLRLVPASHASTLTLLEPFVAVVVAAVALGEALGPLAAAGGAAILLGALLVVMPARAGAA